MAVTIKIITRVTTLLFLAGLTASAATFVSDGSSSDTQAKINSSVDGDTVTIPAGTFTWNSGISINGKGIRLQGGGSGRVVARSTSSVSVGIGPKTFTLNASGISSISPGATLTIERPGTPVNEFSGNGATTGVRTWMKGTVTSYSGTTLTMNTTSTAGSGTHALWIVSTQPTTTITYGGSSGSLMTLDQDASHHVEVTGIKTLWAASGTERSELYLTTTANGKPILIHDCYFEFGGNATTMIIHAESGSGAVIWNCSFPSFPFATAGIAIKQATHADLGIWTSPSSMGALDTDGTKNFYIEDCDFHAYLNCTDWDANSKAVIRHCLFNNAGTGTHGADSTIIGVRHYEWYNNEFTFNNIGAQTFNMNWWFFLRGGTGVFTDNQLDDINSGQWGNKSEFVMAQLNLREQWGLNPCYGANTPGVQYPCPRQIGSGYTAGTRTDGYGRLNDGADFVGDLEPLYIWNNSGTAEIGYANGGTNCGPSADSSAQYIEQGRDFYVGTPKPGYLKYAYPHPLRSATSSGLRTNPVVSLTIAGLDFGALKVGMIADLTVSVRNVGGGILAGTATTAQPFSILGGAIYSLSSNQTQVISVRYAPQTSGVQIGSVTLTGGGGASVALKGSASVF